MKTEALRYCIQSQFGKEDYAEARLELTALETEINRLTTFNESMQTDARKNTETIRTLKQELDALKACKHMHVKIHSRLYRPSTREEPAEYEYKAECKDCKEWFSADDVDEWAEVEE